MLQDNKNPVSLATLVLCDTLIEAYHSLWDSGLISSLRFAVFYGIVADAFKATIANIELEDEKKVDIIIQRY